MMLPQQRKQHILREIQQHGSAQVQELAEELKVSAMTVRRDLAELEEAGLLSRIHGGAVPTASSLEPSFTEKMALQADEKTDIAFAALEFVHDGQSLGFTAGTTCTRIAQEIAANETFRNLTVVTNSLSVAQEFYRVAESRTQGHRVILTGGEHTPSDALVGPVADTTIERLSLDLLFLGAHGANTKGLTSPNLDEARTNETMTASAENVIAVFDHTKWGVPGLARFASWDEISAVVTTAEIPADARTFLTDSVERLVIA
ncbi:MAG: DeoR/GlpR family DNA-binding transcription regulator [Rothia sp. (in: high G+C Gram-positive bacteria)]|nr:DeoR/GlpR family DNA-binding transcription regulator [Rothia sp. (in: high G+C Gram-positive bacteria)]